jgi:spore coat polysaccharide biosynthesis protein SpsF (cytidylyltransferase family)
MFAEWYDVKSLHRANRKATDPMHREYPGSYFLERVEPKALTLIPAPRQFCENDLCLTIESEDDWEDVIMIFESIDADNIQWHHIAELLSSLHREGKNARKPQNQATSIR